MQPVSIVLPSDLLSIKEDTSGNRTDTPTIGGCFSNYLPGAHVSWDKDETETEPVVTTQSSNSYDRSGEEVKGCFLVDMKYRDNPSNQKAISLATELALTKGNHGLAIWSTVSSLTKYEHTFKEKIYAVRLSKQGDKWKVEKGYTWYTIGKDHNESFTHLEIYFDNDKIGELDDSSACKAQNSNTCDLFTKTPPTKTFRYSGSFRSGHGSQKIFTKLKVKDKNSEPDFWGHENIFATPSNKSSRGFTDFAYVYDGTTSKWKKRQAIQAGVSQASYLKNTLEAWFKPFTDSTGWWTQWHKG